MRRYSMYLAFAVSLGLGSQGFSQAPAPADLIPQLAGCFQIHYRYVEDGAHDNTLGSTEWIENNGQGGELSFHHWGVVGQGASLQYWDHWSETWTPEANGQWHRIVLYPGDLHTRYECSGAFHFNQWQCSANGAEKPIRDLGRTDYDVLDRQDTLQITPKGFVQSENNLKRKNDGTQVSNEVGWNEYTRVDNSVCGK